MKSILIALFLVVGLAGCENPVRVQSSAVKIPSTTDPPTLAGTWKWTQVIFPTTKSKQVDSVAGIPALTFTSTNGWAVASAQSQFAAVAVQGTDTYPTAKLGFAFGSGATWTDTCRYITPDSVLGILPGAHHDTLQFDILVRVH